MSDEHDHDHNGGNGHAGMRANEEMSYYARRALALESVLVEKGVISGDDVRRFLELGNSRTPADGARIVARAWTDAAFKERLLANAKAAVAELGYTDSDDLPDVVVVENTASVHYLVVCTLCSCYPTWLLGPPPDWYKSLTYRQRAVNDPRGVMREFGLELSDDVEARVLDSTAEIRYMVLPRRPDGTDTLGEDELQALVTRDSMVGVGEPLAPAIAS